jgi:hypothetical protein
MASTLSLAPAPSLIGKLLPLIEETTHGVRNAILDLDEIANWDANEVNHQCLLSSIETIKDQVKEWQQCFLNKLRSLWLEQTKQYNDYKREVEKVLNIRHCAELDCLFSRLRDPKYQLDLTGANPFDEETKFKQHMFRFGFRYDSETKRLQLVCRRQLEEVSVFQTVTRSHAEQLLRARTADEQRLLELLRKPLEQIDVLIQAVEKKISASHVAASFTIYRRVKPSGSAPASEASGKRLAPTPPPSARHGNDVTAAPPIGSGKWMPAVPHSAPSPHSPEVDPGDIE